MYVEYTGLVNIDGPLIAIAGVRGTSFEEVVEIHMADGSSRLGRVLEIEDDVAVVQVFEGTGDISLTNTRVRFTGRPLEIKMSPEILGRVFDGLGRPIDGFGEIFPEARMDINGSPMNPISRRYPRNFIQTGVSSIDGLTTLIRGQKLPIFSGSGLAHNELAVQLVRQARITGSSEGGFAIVFAAMGVKNDVADYFKKSFEDSGVIDHVTMFINLASDPPVERIVTPRSALTAAEYLAFSLNMDILVIMTDVTAYCESLREISSSKGEIPSRKGFPGYMYSDLASLYERAGLIEGSTGTITQIPILTLPNDDITHPIPDLTGYITEGQIVLDRDLTQKGVYPPVSVLPSLSRLMKDGIGKGYTREDHNSCATQLFSSYARVQEVRALASVIGEDELTAMDKLYMEFGRAFESEFLSQGQDENRPIEATLDLGWRLLGILPAGELDRVDEETLRARYPGYAKGDAAGGAAEAPAPAAAPSAGGQA
jgi:V/A-type H+-transporting ATPase subunit B